MFQAFQTDGLAGVVFSTEQSQKRRQGEYGVCRERVTIFGGAVWQRFE
ncbi:MAG: hypothetical protein ACLP59_04005 [Bryobacteraceae bacterium]